MNPKKQITFLTKLYTDKLSECRDYDIQINRLTYQYENLLKLLCDDLFHKLLCVQSVNGVDYATYLYDFMHDGHNQFSVEFVSKPLSYPNPDKAAWADAEITGHELSVVNLDACPFRCGHASRLLRQIENYARANEIEIISGDIYERTPIGIGNLIRFYEKNGYTVYEENGNRHFRKTLV